MFFNLIKLDYVVFFVLKTSSSPSLALPFLPQPSLSDKEGNNDDHMDDGEVGIITCRLPPMVRCSNLI